ncbi:methionyl-tRNA formyltransferase [Roseinatronobacter sp.]|uniref:methionyl-tRNA formyltransferase n=1 Tax=Roseinatronobacter sp. TaxID=1945755 RepID=UPI0025D8808B|nr:methionyl-tRNA formyltransferase [Rhodobaca sp.]
MRVIFMGTPDFSVPALEAVHAQHEVVCIYTQPPRPAGRGKKPRPTPVHARAEALGLDVRHPASLKDPAAQAEFAALNADIAVVVAYGLILPQAVLDAPRLGCLNIHASLLPRWRGAAPIQRAIMAGDSETGICIMQMEAGLDTGPVLLRDTTPIAPLDTAQTLHDRLSDMGAKLIARALAQLSDLTPTPQPEEGVTYAAKIDKAEARIDWTRPAEDVARHIRGLSPFPGVWFDSPFGRLKLLNARAVDGQGSPGTLIDGLTIACGTGAVEVLDVQREGKRAMSAQEMLRGAGAARG